MFTPFSVFLLTVNIFLAWLYLRPGAHWLPRPFPVSSHDQHQHDSCASQPDRLPPLVPQEWTLQELRQYDGVQSKRILIAVDWRVFDVTSGRRHYGPSASYGALAGRDATRALAANKVYEYPKDFTQSFDDYLDLTVEEREIVNGWVDFFYKKYPEVGLLVRVKDERFVHPEDIFSEPGAHPSGGIMDDLHYA